MLGLVSSEPPRWRVLTRMAFLGGLRPDGSAYRTIPDLCVYRRPIDPLRDVVALRLDGPPLLVIEVLSDTTAEADLSLTHGKGYTFARAGVAEYLALDPLGGFVPEGLRGWRLVDGVYQPQPLGPDGRWHSAQIAVAIGLEGIWATVYTPDGRRLLREGEVEAEIARLRRLLDEARGPE